MIYWFLILFIIAGIWGITLRALDDTDHFLFNPILTRLVRYKLIYYPVCYIFMLFYRTISQAPIWSIMMLILWIASFTDRFSYIDDIFIYKVAIGFLLISAVFKTIERGRRDIPSKKPNKYLTMSIDDLIASSRQTILEVEKTYRRD